MPSAWRLVNTRRAAQAFSGEGPRRRGSRWTSPGRRVTYVSEALSLALVEVLVHVRKPLLQPVYSRCRVDFEDGMVEAVDRSDLPDGWHSGRPPLRLRAIGDAWLRSGRSLMLRVPSAVVEIESNFLINPTHADFGRLEFAKPELFTLDPRFASFRSA